MQYAAHNMCMLLQDAVCSAQCWEQLLWGTKVAGPRPRGYKFAEYPIHDKLHTAYCMRPTAQILIAANCSSRRGECYFLGDMHVGAGERGRFQGWGLLGVGYQKGAMDQSNWVENVCFQN